MRNDTATMTVELPVEVKERLETLARTTDRSPATLATDAISSFVELQEWQLQEIRKGIQEADAGELATDEEVAAVFAKWVDAR